ncbi:MAG: hypothetical protein ACYDH3_02380 [Candidatus Aminicenantales bacterium]
MTRKHVYVVLGAVLLLAWGAVLSAPRQGARRPEYREIIAAQKIADPAVRLKEFERIKAAYPQSTMMTTLDNLIRNLKISLCSTLDEVLAVQKTTVGIGMGFARIASWFNAAMEIINHPNLASFDKNAVLKTVLAYQAEVGKLVQNKLFTDSLPEGERPRMADFVNNLRIAAALAHLNAGNAVKAAAALGAYKAAGGVPNAMYEFASAEAAAKSGKNADALAGYLAAAVENYENAAEKARGIWIKVKGSADGFETALEAERIKMPFRPSKIAAPPDWKGKTVLAELFTGSECPACLSADFGFAGLIESVPVPCLAILEYHLAFPRPDPMMNPATRTRREYYDINAAPAVFFDGKAIPSGSGSGRAKAGEKYKQYLAEITPRLKEIPATLLEAKAVRDGDRVTVDVALENPVATAEIFVALVEKEVPYKGGNGVILHRMIVRDLRTIAIETPQAVFDLAASERTTDEYLTAIENSYDKVPNFHFPERRNLMGREGLRAIVFLQDKKTKRVFNAFSIDVK